MSDTVRSSPTGDGKEIWEAFWASLSDDQAAIADLYRWSLDLFREAAVTFDAGALGAAAITCRAAIESACFAALTWVRVDETTYAHEWPLDLTGKVRRVSFPELLEALKKRGILEPDLFSKVEKAKDDGDLIAHLTARHAREQVQAQARYARSKIPPIRDQRRLWVSPEEVVSNLECAGAVLRVIFEMTRILPVAGEGA